MIPLATERPNPPHYSRLVLDSTSAMYLHASGAMERILSESGMKFVVERYTLRHEWIWKLDRGDDLASDLTGMIERGLIALEDLRNDEAAAVYIALALDRIGDGTARAAALALQGRCGLLVDCMFSRRIAGQRCAGLPLVSTPGLLRRWAVEARPDSGDVQQRIRAIEEHGHFRLASSDPDATWWVTVRNG